MFNIFPPLIHDFMALDVYSRSIILSILVLIPYWYIVLYFIDREFAKTPTYINIMFCFCLSIVWYLVILLLLSSVVLVFNQEKDFNDTYLGFCGIMSILALTVASVVSNRYSFTFFKKESKIKGFLLTYFCLFVVLFFLGALIYLFIK